MQADLARQWAGGPANLLDVVGMVLVSSCQSSLRSSLDPSLSLAFVLAYLDLMEPTNM